MPTCLMDASGAMCAVLLTLGAVLGALSADDAAGPLVIVAFGDSTTALRDTVRKVYAQWLAEELPKKGLPVQVINAGVGGNSTDLARARFAKDVLSRRPGLVIIQFGINDSAVDVWRTPPATASRVPLARYEENLRYFVHTLKERGAKVILMTPNPLRWTEKTKEMYGKPPYDPIDPKGFSAPLVPYAQAVRTIAREEHVALVDVFAAVEAYGSTQGQSVDELLLDGMHPNDKGHRLVADLLLREVLGAK